MDFYRKVDIAAKYDVIVAGGGVAGVAAAVSASRMGKRTLLIEKSIGLGGLATNGLINLFVPMCNGRGVQIIKGMAEELLRLSIQYGYDTIPEAWKKGEPGNGETTRYLTQFSAPIFTLALTEFVNNENVDILFDTLITVPVMEDNICKGLIVENKTGCEFYAAKMIVDTTGDADVLYRAGVPTVQGKNYHTYVPKSVTLESCRRVLEHEDMSKLYSGYFTGGRANLYGDNQPQGKATRGGTTATDVTEYVIENHLECLANIKDIERSKRTIVALPTMPQFRTTRHIYGDYVLRTDDAYKHFEDSIATICDFDRRDYLYEVPYRTLIKSGYPNLITAGRCAAAEGYAWDVLRVIPPAILTGQAAGVACAIAIDDNVGIDKINVNKLQENLQQYDVMIHFDDALVPKYRCVDERAGLIDHI